MNVQYLQNVVCSFEKVQMVKNTPPEVPTTLVKQIIPSNISHSPAPLNAIWKTLGCLQLIRTHRMIRVLKCLHLHTKGRGGVKFWMISIPWKYNIRRNLNSDFSIVTIRRVAIIFFELVATKKFHAKYLIRGHFTIILLFKELCLIATVSIENRIV